MQNTKKYFGTVILCVFSLSVLALAGWWYSKNLQITFKEESIISLEEISKQGALLLHNEINNKKNRLLELADSIDDNFEEDPQGAVNLFQETVVQSQLKRIGIIVPNGDAYTTDNQKLNLANRAYFQSALAGKTTISTAFSDRDGSGESIIVYSAPITIGGVPKGALFATYEMNTFKKLVEVSFFNGAGYAYLVTNDGEFIVNAAWDPVLQGFTNIYAALLKSNEENKQAAERLWNLIREQEDGYLEFRSDGVLKYMHCTPIGVNNWMLLTVIPASVMDAKVDLVMRYTYYLGILMLFLFLLFIGHIIRMYADNQKELINIAYVDNITGGYSLARFYKEAAVAVRKKDTNAAIISMDIDGFKYFNDVFGYEEGNNLIRFIWGGWQKEVKPDELVAHDAADRFICLLYFKDREELLSRLDNVCEKFAAYQTKGKERYKIMVSLGIYVVERYLEDVQSMADRAYIARQTIKNKTNIKYAFYDDSIRNELLREKELEGTMEKALREKDFLVYYQPKYTVTTEELNGAEALVRWRQKSGTITSPNEFIPLFERNGFIIALDKYMFTEVCRQQKAWLDQGKKIVPVSVNLSKTHLYDPNLVNDYINIINSFNLSHKYVELELTESAICENMDIMQGVIQEFRDLGFRVLMDDFGTGYSSLVMLKNVKIDVLKMDKSFVDDIGDIKGEKIVSNIISLTKSLGIEVTAEGVETREQFEFLRAANCDNIQGYYFNKPMPIDVFAKILNDTNIN